MPPKAAAIASKAKPKGVAKKKQTPKPNKNRKTVKLIIAALGEALTAMEVMSDVTGWLEVKGKIETVGALVQVIE